MRATTRETPNVSRDRRAEMMFDLSPLETAANAPARSIPADLGPEPAEGVGVLVDDGHGVATRVEVVREGGTQPPTSHDHHVHESRPPGSILTRVRVPCAGNGRVPGPDTQRAWRP